MSKNLNILDLSDNIFTPCNSPNKLNKLDKHRPPPIISIPKDIYLCNYLRNKKLSPNILSSLSPEIVNKENYFNFNNTRYLSDNTLDLIKQKLNKKSN